MSDEQQEVKTEALPAAVPAIADEVIVSTELKNIIEALIFASDEPMTPRFIRSIMDDVNKDLPPSGHFIVNAEIIRKAVGDLNRGYGRMGSGFRIIEIAGGFIYATQEEFSSWVGKLAKEKARRRLSPTAVETLAIIAYKQPIAKGEVEFIRGVNVDYIINALLEKDLIHITGRAHSPGRPLLYGTTQKFLEHFGLNDLTDLPKPREISELINETELEVDRRLLAEQQELEFKEDLEKKLEGNEGSRNKPQKPAKNKMPDAVKEENRRGAQQQSGTADDKAADGQRSAEGVASSESNTTQSEATAEVRGNVPENLPVSEQDRSAQNGPENREAPPEHSAGDPDHHSAQGAEAETEGVQGARMTAVPEDLITDDRENRGNTDQDHLTTDVPENRVSADQVHSMTDVPENRKRDGLEVSAVNAPGDQGNAAQDRSVTAAKADSAIVPEDRSAAEPVQHPDGNRTHVPTREAAEHMESSTAEEHRDQGQQQSSPPGSETGWSKWKNKVKTFFQKLFA